MNTLSGRYRDRRILFIGLSGAELGGVRNSAMVCTLDAAMDNQKLGFDYISILRADSEKMLRGVIAELDIEVTLDEQQAQPVPGLIQKPEGGAN